MFYMVGDQRLCDARHYLGICCLRRRWCSGSVGSAAHGSVLSKIDLHRGNDIPRPRDKTPKIAFRPETVSAETKTQPQKPANCGLLGSLREISRLGRVRGGPERTRTACQARSHIEPVSETSQTARLIRLEPVSSWTIESRQEAEFYEQRQSGANRRLAVKDRSRD